MRPYVCQLAYQSWLSPSSVHGKGLELPRLDSDGGTKLWNNQSDRRRQYGGFPLD
jgi:hypothetical protein